MHLVKRGVQIAIRPTWAFQFLPPEGGCFWRKQPCSPGRAGWQAPPLFCYKYGEEWRRKGFSLLSTSHSLEITEENYFREENPSRGASVTFPWVITRRFSTVLQHSSFVLRFLQSSTGKYLKPSFSIHFLFFWLSSLFRSLSVSFLPFLTSFNRSFKPFSRLINDKMNFNRSFAL